MPEPADAASRNGFQVLAFIIKEDPVILDQWYGSVVIR